MSIHRLSLEVVNQIAAGEVVERPSHLVKELIENSIDAGATSVEVEFDQGGRRVRVTDNGRGIASADLALALARHATSKITSADDLWKLGTFGFRGEALASIAAVSRIELTSRTEKSPEAYQLRAQFGESSGVHATGANTGTSVLIEDLFENTPARLKFLKSETAELTQIKAVVRALALAHPNVEFRQRSQGKVLQVWAATDGLLARACQVLELEDLHENQMTFNGFAAHAVFASPHEVTGHARSMWIFAQDRWVQDRGLQAAVIEAYRGLLMHGEYPIAVIRLQAPADQVDVNIHPTKSQVKFRDPQSAFRAVNRCVREGLEHAPWLQGKLQTAGDFAVREAVSAYAQARLSDDSALTTTFFAKREDVKQAKAHGGDRGEAQRAPNSYGAATSNQFVRSAGGTVGVSATEPASSPSAPNGYWSGLQVIGQANLTYIITQASDRLVLVDQHAAHERIAYERLMRGWRDGSSEIQDFLLPVTLELRPDLVEVLVHAAPDLQRIGIFIDGIGPGTIAVRSAPSLLSETALVKSLERLASEISEKGGSFAIEKHISDLFASMACHSVVRAGQSMSVEQMQSLLVQMDEFPLSSFCPHGRPVAFEYPFARLERDFGRIV